MSSSLADLAPGVRERAAQTIEWARSHGVLVTVTSTRRTRQEQRALRERYEQALASGTFGQAGGVEYPANRPGDSAHEHGLAFDSVTVNPEQLDYWVKVRQTFGWRVPHDDAVHAELPHWRDAVRHLREAGIEI